MRATSYLLATQQVVDDIPFATFRFSPFLSQPGGWSATINCYEEKASPDFLAEEVHGIIFTADTDDERLGIAAAGEALFAGALWDLEVDGDTLKVGGEGLWSYFRDERRNFRGVPPVANVTLATDFDYTNAPDQFQLTTYLLVLAQSGLAENIGLDVRWINGLSGITRTGVIKASELKPYAQIIEDWANADDGFDFNLKVEWANSQPRFHLDLYYPARGIDLDDPWMIGSHVTLDGPWRRTAGANLIDAVGATVGSEPLRRSAVGTPKGLRIERVVQNTDIDNGPLLKGIANAELARANHPVGTCNVKISDFTVCGLDKWSIGDTIPLVGPVSGYTTIDEPNRIMGYEVSVDENRAITVTVDLEPA